MLFLPNSVHNKVCHILVADIVFKLEKQHFKKHSKKETRVKKQNPKHLPQASANCFEMAIVGEQGKKIRVWLLVS